LGFIGPKYMWNNGQEGKGFTQEHLDRAVVNPEWCEKWPRLMVHVLAKRSSDHHPLLITLVDREGVSVNKQRLFCYDASWSKNNDVKEVIQ
jgi:hypothetical protein